MPAVSKAQSKYLNVTKGHAWVKAHHFANSTEGLPEHVGGSTVKGHSKHKKHVHHMGVHHKKHKHHGGKPTYLHAATHGHFHHGSPHSMKLYGS